MRPLSAASPRRIAAARFGAELRRAMTERQIGQKRLADAVGCAPSAVAVWKAGDNLPRTDTAVRVADALGWPRLVEIAREGRSGLCTRCGKTFVNEGGSPKRFCSADCRNVDVALREPPPGRALADAVWAEIERQGPIRIYPLRAALEHYARHDSKRVARGDRSARQLIVAETAVAAMCRDCEPSGVCRTPECPLRPVSPLPLALAPDKTAALVGPAEGPWGPTNRPVMVAAIRAANAERWSRPDERARAAAAMHDRHAAMTPEERQARIDKARTSYPPERRSETSRTVHARRRAEA